MIGRNICLKAAAAAVLAALIYAGIPLPLAAIEVCATCGKAITGDFYWFKSPARATQLALCKACSQLEARCSQCQIPVTERAKPLGDGRLLCELDARVAIFDEREAQRIFEDTKRALFPILNGLGVMPDRNITVRLIDLRQMKELQGPSISPESQNKTLGLTRTRRIDGQHLDHTIFMLNGLCSARLMAVGAHEYAHTWLHENVPAQRKIDKDTVEGFCELVAYQVMSKLGQDVEKQVILANAYTKGQIRTLMETGDRYQFYNLVSWMKSGKDDRLSATDQSRVLSLQPSESNPAASWALPVKKTPVPDTLELRGISGAANRRFALINDQTLAVNEEAKVRVGGSSVVVRCLEIRKASVLVQVKGSQAPLELTLEASP